MALIVYNEAKYFLSTGVLNLATDTLKGMLVTTGYIVDPNHRVVDDGTLLAPSLFEVTGTGYIGGYKKSGRVEITNKSVVRDEVTFRVRLFGDDLLWSLINVGIVGGLLIIREGTSSDTTSLLIGYTNEGGFPLTTDGGELLIRFHVNGILAL